MHGQLKMHQHKGDWAKKQKLRKKKWKKLKEILFCHRTIPLEFRYGPIQKEEARKPSENSQKFQTRKKEKRKRTS